MSSIDALVSDILRLAAATLFAGAAYYLKGLADAVTKLRERVDDQGQRIAKIEGVHDAQAML